ncbi:MAG: ribulose-phosphate 3-epimerase [Candidatus Diapherotrites archaeon]
MVLMARVFASMLSMDYACLGETVNALECAKVDALHFDVMDGNYVPNITYGAPLIKSLRASSKLFFDSHLMISKPDAYVKDFAEAGSDLIVFHLETSKNPKKTIKSIHDFGVKAGICLNARVSEKKALPFLQEIDFLLVMSVEAGFGGQKFMPSALKKIGILRKKIDAESISCGLAVDGGINAETGALAVNAGADVLISGSYILKNANLNRAVESLKKL